MHRGRLPGLIAILVALWQPGCGDERELFPGQQSVLQLYVVDQGGEPVRQISAIKGEAEESAWSPNGRLIAMGANIDPTLRGQITVFTPDGDMIRRIAVPGVPTAVSWTPDGKEIHFLMGLGIPDEQPGAWLGSVGVTGDSLEISPVGFRIREAAWSPDADTLAFSVKAERFPPPDAAAAQMEAGSSAQSYLWLIDADGARLRATDRIPGTVGQPAYSPDSRQVAFVGLAGRQESVWSTSATGSRPQLLAESLDDVSIDWSPDARQLAVVGTRGQAQPTDIYDLNLYTLSARGGEPEQIAEGLAARVPAWSPDGGVIAAITDDNGDNSIRLVPVSGGAERSILDFRNTFIQDAQWSPDGSDLAFTGMQRPAD